jgi:hypothetical protein
MIDLTKQKGKKMKTLTAKTPTGKEVIITVDDNLNYTVNVPAINLIQHPGQLNLRSSLKFGDGKNYPGLWINKPVALDGNSYNLVKDFEANLKSDLQNRINSIPGYKELTDAYESKANAMDTEDDLRQKSFDTSIYAGSVDADATCKLVARLESQYPDAKKYIALAKADPSESLNYLNQITKS